MRIEYEIDFEPDVVRISDGDTKASISSVGFVPSPEMIKRRIFDFIYGEIANEIAAAYGEYDDTRIEERSLSMIDSIMSLDIENPMRHIVIKAIHAASDFSIAPLVRYSSGFFSSFLNKLKKGCSIICDSEMVRAGIYSRPVLESNSVVCYLNDPRSKETADKDGITRSAAGIKIALQENSNSVLVIGNSPTALHEAVRILALKKRYDIPIVGIPVGFVNTTRVKEQLVSSGLEYITLDGHRGGSPIAASIVNGFGRFLV